MPQADEKLVIAKSEDFIGLLPKMANRHGLIAGATGTGKTVTLRVLAEAFSRIGVPVFMADVKGDLSGLIKPGGDKPKVAERVETLGLKDFQFRAYPGGLLGCGRRAGAPGAHHHLRYGAAALGPAPQSERHPERGLDSGL